MLIKKKIDFKISLTCAYIYKRLIDNYLDQTKKSENSTKKKSKWLRERLSKYLATRNKIHINQNIMKASAFIEPKLKIDNNL